MSDDPFNYLTTELFDDLYVHCNSIIDGDNIRNIEKNQLFVYLCKMGNGLTDELLKVIYIHRHARNTFLQNAHPKENKAVVIVDSTYIYIDKIWKL